MNKISLKLGFWFLVVMLLMEVFLLYFLHKNIVITQIEKELSALQARGNNHRDVLEESYRPETLQHISLMELSGEMDVIVTDNNQNIIISSSKLDPVEEKILSYDLKNVPRNGKVIEQRWRDKKYISTVTPYSINANEKGYVYMFQNTNQVQEIITNLNHHFIVAAVITGIFLILTILFLTKVLTTPLIRMKKATEKLSKGDFSVHLPKMGKDELGDLFQSIKILANDLKYLREERNEFLASISHELRTPLTYIKGYAEVARRKNLIDKERDQYLEIIYEESEKLSVMIKDLFNLAKIDRNSFVIDRINVQLCFFFHSLYEKVLPAFKEKGVELELICKKNVIVRIDPIRFEQILLNLLNNALKYSEPHTTTSISVKREKGKVRIEIKDEGSGIPKEDVPFIFERFYRVEKSRSRDSGGTGLGLSIVKELIESHEGNIEVKSEPGKGSTFIISIEEETE
ncbi:ATP-binding protein (plasmid) [Metabacillus halosaccharovorans]|uniref:ATP-binding protein n=1 Tax=Metabacillus halosaccharovorans TaxID=930124 RepID=UPI000C80619B|nr:ATP-binding protein [Metabacillus halosaccharovorans]MCM3441522.1 ATP-binding protein [Metabacillus halosaccharovorans]PMC36364.1 two-component sensor histidine kinase [Bacillus sp. UMB0899]